MPRPSVKTFFSRPGYGWVDVSSCVDISSSYEITDAVESPSETNVFVAPDVQVKIHVGDLARGEFQLSWFDGILPESMDYLLRIQSNGAVIFSGFVLPTTLQFDDVERWAAFTAAGLGAKLARTSAEAIGPLKRPVSDGWRVYQAAGNESLGTVTIESVYGPQPLCEIVSGDTVTVEMPGGRKDELLVQGVGPTTDTSPYAYFELTVTGLKQVYEAGSIVTLITPFVRNVAMRTLVDRLFIAAGLNPTTSATYRIAPLSGAAAPFATPPSMVGLENIAPLGVSTYVTDTLGSDPPGAFPLLGTNVGVWKQETPPTGDWTFYAHPDTALYPVDWRPYGSGKWLQYGRRYRRTLIWDGEVPPNVTGALYTFWCYDYYSDGAPATFLRYRLEIEVDNFDGRATVYTWQTRLYAEQSADGRTWTTTGGPYGATSGSTVARLHDEIPLTCGLDIVKLLGFKRVIFTEPDSASDPCGYVISQMTTAGAVTRGIGPAGVSIRGNVFQHTLDRLAIARRDTARSDTPTLFVLADDGAGSLTVENSTPIPADLQPFTLRYNAGDGFWYALSASKENGVRLLSFAGSTLALRSGYEPASLFPPSGLIGSADMTVVEGASGTTYPMLAIFGNQLWWISRSSSGWIAYADLEGLSCGDALAQLATLVDGTFYVTATEESFFISRGIASGRTIATGTSSTSSRMDDAGCVAKRRASIFWKSYRYASVTNERDDTVTGEAGDTNFRDTEQGAARVNRFVPTSSLAVALAQHLLSYLGRKLEAYEVTHEADGRNYGIGRTFTMVRGGVTKSYAIIESTPTPLAGTVRVVGLEL